MAKKGNYFPVEEFLSSGDSLQFSALGFVSEYGWYKVLGELRVCEIDNEIELHQEGKSPSRNIPEEFVCYAFKESPSLEEKPFGDNMVNPHSVPESYTFFDSTIELPFWFKNHYKKRWYVDKKTKQIATSPQVKTSQKSLLEEIREEKEQDEEALGYFRKVEISPDFEYTKSDFLPELVCRVLWRFGWGTKVGWSWYVKQVDKTVSYYCEKNHHKNIMKPTDDGKILRSAAFLKQEFPEFVIHSLSEVKCNNEDYNKIYPIIKKIMDEIRVKAVENGRFIIQPRGKMLYSGAMIDSEPHSEINLHNDKVKLMARNFSYINENSKFVEKQVSYDESLNTDVYVLEQWIRRRPKNWEVLFTTKNGTTVFDMEVFKDLVETIKASGDYQAMVSAKIKNDSDLKANTSKADTKVGVGKKFISGSLDSDLLWKVDLLNIENEADEQVSGDFYLTKLMIFRVPAHQAKGFVGTPLIKKVWVPLKSREKFLVVRRFLNAVQYQHRFIKGIVSEELLNIFADDKKTTVSAKKCRLLFEALEAVEWEYIGLTSVEEQSAQGIVVSSYYKINDTVSVVFPSKFCRTFTIWNASELSSSEIVSAVHKMYYLVNYADNNANLINIPFSSISSDNSQSNKVTDYSLIDKYVEIVSKLDFGFIKYESEVVDNVYVAWLLSVRETVEIERLEKEMTFFCDTLLEDKIMNYQHINLLKKKSTLPDVKTDEPETYEEEVDYVPVSEVIQGLPDSAQKEIKTIVEAAYVPISEMVNQFLEEEDDIKAVFEEPQRPTLQVISHAGEFESVETKEEPMSVLEPGVFEKKEDFIVPDEVSALEATDEKLIVFSGTETYVNKFTTNSFEYETLSVLEDSSIDMVLTVSDYFVSPKIASELYRIIKPSKSLVILIDAADATNISTSEASLKNCRKNAEGQVDGFKLIYKLTYIQKKKLDDGSNVMKPFTALWMAKGIPAGHELLTSNGLSVIYDSDYKTAHTGLFLRPLILWIKELSSVGDIVLDFDSKNGTVARACQITDRSHISITLSETNTMLGYQRIEQNDPNDNEHYTQESNQGKLFN